MQVAPQQTHCGLQHRGGGDQGEEGCWVHVDYTAEAVFAVRGAVAAAGAVAVQELVSGFAGLSEHGGLNDLAQDEVAVAVEVFEVYGGGHGWSLIRRRAWAVSALMVSPLWRSCSSGVEGRWGSR